MEKEVSLNCFYPTTVAYIFNLQVAIAKVCMVDVVALPT